MRLNGSMGRIVHHSQRPHASIQQDSAPVLKGGHATGAPSDAAAASAVTFAAAPSDGNASPPRTFASSATVFASAPLSTTRPPCSPSGVTSRRTGAPVRLGSSV